MLGAGLVVVAGLIFTLFSTTKGAHLRLEGKVLKVRVLALNAGSSLVVADFRVANPSDVPFVVNSVKLILDPAKGDPIEGMTAARSDLDRAFEYAKVLGPKYNDVLTIQDRVAPHASMDRMAGARIELPEAAINTRKNLRVQFEDVDGTIAEVGETNSNEK